MKGGKFICLVVIAFLFGCQGETVLEYKPTEVILTVFDDLGDPLSGASVKLFDEEEAYLSERDGDTALRYIEIETSDLDGMVTFTDLNPELTYYVLVSFKDRTRFVDLNNFSEQFVVKSEDLSLGSTLKASIQLEQAKSAVTFFVESSETMTLPVKIYLDNELIGELNSTVSSFPEQPFENSTISFRLSNGSSEWFATSSQGCFWDGAFDIGTDDFRPISIGECTTGAITFWTDTSNTDVLPISITLDNGDKLDDLQSASDLPSGCYSGIGISAGRPAGTYTYVARSKNGSCVWTGSIDLDINECQTIQLETCEE